MHLESAHIEQTKQIKQKSEYTSCNPEQTAAGTMMPLTIDRMHTAAIKEGVDENGGWVPGGRTRVPPHHVWLAYTKR